LTRRGDWWHAGEGSLALATLLLRRGRAHDAQNMLNAAADLWRRTGDEDRLIDVAVLTGTVSIELARLDQSETAASAAAAAARSRGDETRTRRALAALTRTLFWRGRYDEADVTLKSITRTDDQAETIAASGLEVAVAAGLGD